MFVWNAYVAAEFTNNVVVVSSDRPTLFAGTTCSQKHENNGGGLCTDRYSDNFAKAKFHSNVYWNSSGTLSNGFPGSGGGMHGFETVQGNLSFEEWQVDNGGHDQGSVIADPLFVDADRFDFRLQQGSPALDRGFEPLELGSVGPDWQPDANV